MTKKKCKKCFLEKELFAFPKHPDGKDGHLNVCKTCKSKYRKNYYMVNKETEINNAFLYRKTFPEKVKKSTTKWNSNNLEYYKFIQKKYRNNNKERLLKNAKKYRTNKRRTNVNFKLACNLRTRLYQAIKLNVKSGSSVNDLGCSIEFFKKYLQSLFKPGMTWENWSKHGWHIDHIIPLTFFDLSNREEFLKATHYTNMQPLWAVDNLKKNKYLIELKNVQETTNEKEKNEN